MDLPSPFRVTKGGSYPHRLQAATLGSGCLAGEAVHRDPKPQQLLLKLQSQAPARTLVPASLPLTPPFVTPATFPRPPGPSRHAAQGQVQPTTSLLSRPLASFPQLRTSPGRSPLSSRLRPIPHSPRRGSPKHTAVPRPCPAPQPSTAPQCQARGCTQVPTGSGLGTQNIPLKHSSDR